MPRILVDPSNLGITLVGIAALISAGYFLRVRDKSASTWFIMAFLGAWAYYFLGQTLWSMTNGAFSTTAAYFFTPYGRLNYMVGALCGPLLAQAAYRFWGNPFRREATVFLVVSFATVIVFMALWQDATNSNSMGRYMVAACSFWGAIVLLRKRARLAKTAELSRERAGMAAVAAFLFVIVISETFAGAIALQGSVPALSLFIIGQILQFVTVLAFPVVYVQYSPEPTTFQVRLVGFVLLIVVSAFGVVAAFASGMENRRQLFDPAPPPHTLSFTPAPSGGFEVTRNELSYDHDFGDNLNLGDDAKARIEIGFGFPFAGDTLRAVVVDANGAIEPSEEPYPEVNFSVAIPTVTTRPLIAVSYMDFNPGVGGSVHADVRSDRVVVTWSEVPEWNYYLPHTLQAVLYDSGQIDFNYIESPYSAYVGARGVLVDAATLAEDGPVPTRLDSLVNAGIFRNPVSVFDRQIEFKEYVHTDTLPFVWVALATIFIVLLFAPIFYRLTLTRPLDRLLQGMRRVNDGDLEAALPVGVKDEFGNLSINFNRMTQSLRSYSSEMESLVDARTRQLNQSLETLKETQEQLVQQEKMASLGELTAGIAHEIKNPLNFINNFADLNAELTRELMEAIHNGEDTDELLHMLEQNATVIAEHGKRADGIVRSMMEHASHGATGRESVDVNVFVEEYLNLAHHGRLASRPGLSISLQRDYADNAGSVTMARQDIGKVLMNLIGNAFDAVSEDDASGHGSVRADDQLSTTDAVGSSATMEHRAGPTVGVRTRREPATSERGTHVVIEIWDNGPGVPPELAKKIFEPFFTTKPTGSGTGLGLSLSYDIVTRGHGGTLTLDESESGGTTMVVKLPA